LRGLLDINNFGDGTIYANAAVPTRSEFCKAKFSRANNMLPDRHAAPLRAAAPAGSGKNSHWTRQTTAAKISLGWTNGAKDV